VRLQLPGSFTWPTSAFNLDRCLLLLSLPREDGKTWVVINVHLEAWDAQGGLKRQELAFLKSLALEKYNEGNYVIVGGDWNSVLPGVRIDQFPSRDKPSQYYQPLPDDFTPGGWTWGVVATRPGNRQGNSRYQPGITYVSVIDGFLVSPNVKIQSVSTLPLDFKDSDHEPVMLQIAGR
jgi:endonuclease/exonuclease/phosphatase family metal-dependent hydrolase